MKCRTCRHGETRPGSATVPLERDGRRIVSREVAAQACDNCGEAFADEAAIVSLLKQAEQVVPAGVKIDVRRFAVAA